MKKGVNSIHKQHYNVTRGAQQSTYPVRNFDLAYSYSMYDELTHG